MAAAQLVLVIEARPGEATLERVRAALEAARFASALIVPASGSRLEEAAVRSLVKLVQERDAAALIHSDAALARKTGADGVHLEAMTGEVDVARVCADARAAVGKGQIVGIAISGLRHDAMVAGEAGADYLAFSGPQYRELVSWWAELFEPPCIALGETGTGVGLPQDTALLVDAGADFIAVALPLAQTAGDIQALMRAHTQALIGGEEHGALRSSAS